MVDSHISARVYIDKKLINHQDVNDIFIDLDMSQTGMAIIKLINFEGQYDSFKNGMLLCRIEFLCHNSKTITLYQGHVEYKPSEDKRLIELSGRMMCDLEMDLQEYKKKEEGNEKI